MREDRRTRRHDTREAARDDPEQLLDHSDFVHAIASALVRDPALADDVAQETLLAAWRAPPAAVGSPRGDARWSRRC